MTETSPACARFCGVCEAPNKPCICPACCRKLIASDRSSYTTLVGRRDALAASVRDALNAQERAHQQQDALQTLLDAAAHARHRADALDAQLQQLEQAVECLTLSNTARTTAIQEASGLLDRQRASFVGHTLPDAARSRQLEYRILAEQLAREQQAKIRSVLEVLPLTITALRTRPMSEQRLQQGDVAPIPCVAACGVRLPEMWDVLGESMGTPSAAGGGGTTATAAAQGTPQEWSTALGYAALTLELLATYLYAPQLHHLSFQGSTSSVWAPKSFLHHAAPGHTGVLPLYPPQAGGTSPIGSGGSGGGGQGPRRTVSMGPPSASGGSGSSLARGIRGLSLTSQTRDLTRRDFARAVQLLQRSAGLLVCHTLRHASANLPADWSAFAWLAGLCDQLIKGNPLVVPLGSVSRSTHTSPVRMQIPDGTPTDMGVCFVPLSCSFDEEEEEVLEGWDVVHRPFLPPPPCSQPDEIEHWSRAMFRDNNTPPGPTPSRLASVSAPLQAAALITRGPGGGPPWGAHPDTRRGMVPHPPGPQQRVSIRHVAKTYHSTRAHSAGEEGAGGSSAASVFEDNASGQSTLLLQRGSGGGRGVGVPVTIAEQPGGDDEAAVGGGVQRRLYTEEEGV